MTHEKSRARAERIRKQYAEGATVKQLVRWYRLGDTRIHQIFSPIPKPQPEPKSEPKDTPRQKRANAELKTYRPVFRMCVDYAKGDCCPICHIGSAKYPWMDLRSYEDEGVPIFLCCEKAHANRFTTEFPATYHDNIVRNKGKDWLLD